jgi:hypothetical protein
MKRPRSAGRRSPVVGVLAMVLAGASPLAAQRATVEALVDLEGWKTDAGSALLARDSGRLAGEARLTLWGALRPMRGLQLTAIGSAQAGTVEPKHASWEYDLLEARWTVSPSLVVNGGKILMPMGLFGARRFSYTNPVIGAPDLYPTQYPWGVNVAGRAGALDLRAAAVSLPVVNTRYTPEPGARLRPLIGAGVTLGPALHLGVAATRGTYLNRNLQPMMPAGRSWDEYRQSIVSGDAHFSAGYLDTRFELAWSAYDVPTKPEPVHGLGGYGEARVALSPRVFVALRGEMNRYAFILPINPFFWVGSETVENNVELGAGYQLTAGWLLKASFRKDDWPQASPPGRFLPDGYAFAVQASWHFYPLEWLRY